MHQRRKLTNIVPYFHIYLNLTDVCINIKDKILANIRVIANNLSFCFEVVQTIYFGVSSSANNFFQISHPLPLQKNNGSSLKCSYFVLNCNIFINGWKSTKTPLGIVVMFCFSCDLRQTVSSVLLLLLLLLLWKHSIRTCVFPLRWFETVFHFPFQLNFMKGLLVCSKRLLLLVDSRCCNNLSTYQLLYCHWDFGCHGNLTDPQIHTISSIQLHFTQKVVGELPFLLHQNCLHIKEHFLRKF